MDAETPIRIWALAGAVGGEPMSRPTFALLCFYWVLLIAIAVSRAKVDARPTVEPITIGYWPATRESTAVTISFVEDGDRRTFTCLDGFDRSPYAAAVRIAAGGQRYECIKGFIWIVGGRSK